MGVKKGTKRGKYKTKNNLQNEKTIVKNDSQKATIKKGNFKQFIERVKNNVIDEDVNSVVNEQTMVGVNNGGNSEAKNFSSSTSSSETQTTTFQATSGEEKLKSFLDEYQQVNEETNNEQGKTETQTETKHDFSTPSTITKNNDLKLLINGYMLLAMCDVVFPTLIRFIFGLFNPKVKKVKITDMKLEPEQREALMASADQVAAYIFEKANPLVIFVVCMGVFYGTNLQTALNNVRDEK